MRTLIIVLLVLASLLCMGTMPAMCAEKTITDMEGRTVTISEPIERVVTAGYGMAPCVMAALGVGDKIVGTGGVLYGQKITPAAPIGADENTMTAVIPALKALPDLGSAATLNIEATVALKPDILILEKSCAGQGSASAAYKELIDKLSLFNKSSPLVVIRNAACYETPSPDTVYEEIRMLGDIFDKEERAQKVVNILKDEISLITERTEDIKPNEMPSVLFMGMIAGTNSGKGGKLALILPDYDCATLYPEINKIKNAYSGKKRESMSSEQLLTFNPDIIILACSPGGYEVERFYNSEDYKALQGMRAIKERRVFSTGRLEFGHNMAGLEFPIEVLIEAKAVYPDRFKDVNVGEQLTKHYKAIYGLDDEQVKELKEAMGLDWMDKEGF